MFSDSMKQIAGYLILALSTYRLLTNTDKRKGHAEHDHKQNDRLYKSKVRTWPASSIVQSRLGFFLGWFRDFAFGKFLDVVSYRIGEGRIKGDENIREVFVELRPRATP